MEASVTTQARAQKRANAKDNAKDIVHLILQMLGILYAASNDDEVRYIMRVCCTAMKPLIDAKFPGLVENLMFHEKNDNRALGHDRALKKDGVEHQRSQ